LRGQMYRRRRLLQLPVKLRRRLESLSRMALRRPLQSRVLLTSVCNICRSGREARLIARSCPTINEIMPGEFPRTEMRVGAATPQWLLAYRPDHRPKQGEPQRAPKTQRAGLGLQGHATGRVASTVVIGADGEAIVLLTHTSCNPG
jgi:hypothetical protein